MKIKYALVSLIIFIQCTTLDKRTFFHGFYKPLQDSNQRESEYAIRYGYGSECLVLMNGPVPSRMEPCAIGDRRSGKELYEGTKVKVEADFVESDWYIAGFPYSYHVNNQYYQDVILFSTSYQRREYERFPDLYFVRGRYGIQVVRNTFGYPYPLSTGFFMRGR
jgi:hypothetical protein